MHTFTFNQSEIWRLTEALQTETRSMRAVVAEMNHDAIHNPQHCHENTIGAREVLAELEQLLDRVSAVDQTAAQVASLT